VIWFCLSFIMTNISLLLGVHYQMGTIVDALKFWKGNFYLIQMVALGASVPVMMRYPRRKYRKPMLLFWTYTVIAALFVFTMYVSNIMLRPPY